MSCSPTRLELVADNQLLIEWNDGQRRQYTFRELRDACPCASCRESRPAPSSQPPPLLPIIPDADRQPPRIVRMRPVGNYAYSIDFSDGHNTGIYTFELLRELGHSV